MSTHNSIGRLSSSKLTILFSNSSGDLIVCILYQYTPNTLVEFIIAAITLLNKIQFLICSSNLPLIDITKCAVCLLSLLLACLNYHALSQD